MTGVACVSVKTGEITVIGTQNVVLCTGGPSGVYENTVYPESQHGSTGLAVDAGALLCNMEEWQYGIASTDFRWNLSGTYQQVLPRYVSVGEDGAEREFLYDALGADSLGLIFLKGYQWPFDTRKTDGSSKVDLLVSEQIKKGRRVYLDYTQNPKGLQNGFGILPEEAYAYLQRSGALSGTPVQRLRKMNEGAYELYLHHGIDLEKDRLRIAVCAQHCNGGVDVDENWQTRVQGLYCAGEAAGTFGVYRPGGSALNSTQVGSLRAAEHIAKRQKRVMTEPEYETPKIRYGEPNAGRILKELQREMSRCADFDRNTGKMKELFCRVSGLCDRFSDEVITDKAQLPLYFRLYDTALAARAVLSAMICSAENVGTHGSALVDGKPNVVSGMRTTRTLTDKDVSQIVPVTPMPDPELWFETLLARQRKDKKRGEDNA